MRAHLVGPAPHHESEGLVEVPAETRVIIFERGVRVETLGAYFKTGSEDSLGLIFARAIDGSVYLAT